MSRLALGTAQFGMRYGVANTVGQVGIADIAAILARASQGRIDTLDTAIAYGDSESNLGRCGIRNWRVISKLPPLPAQGVDPVEWVESHVRGSLERLRIERLDALLLHRSQDLLASRGEDYRRVLRGLVDKGWVGSIGVSIYEPSELDALWDAWRPQIVQAPYNVLDRRLAKSGWLDRLHESGVRVHVRSAFLQGLLLVETARIPAYFSRWLPLFDEWHEWCRARGSDALCAALSFVLADDRIESTVVGVESVQQLEDILGAAETPAPEAPAEFFSSDLELIDPRRWVVR